jgi:hypothetical protein
MLKLQRRLRSLEKQLGMKRGFTPYVHRIIFVDGDGTQTGFMVFSDDPELTAPYQSLVGTA